MPPVSVPAPVPPDDADAWYTPQVHAQRELYPGVVATITEATDGFEYRIRDPPLTETEQELLTQKATTTGRTRRPLTREGLQERITQRVPTALQEAVEETAASLLTRYYRLQYHLVRDRWGFGAATPLALDDRIEIADFTEANVIVHTERFAPVHTAVSTDKPHVNRAVYERIARYSVTFAEFDVPVVIYRDRGLGTDAFDTKYAVREPPIPQEYKRLIPACKDRIWDGGSDDLIEDRAAFVTERARTIFAQLIPEQTGESILSRVQTRVKRLVKRDTTAEPLGQQETTTIIETLTYYVVRDFIGEGKLTIPIRDAHLEDIEANRVGERIKVVPRAPLADGDRMPTNLTFESETEFINVVTELAARNGIELTAANPSAKVNLQPEEVSSDVTIRCAVALPTISEAGPHVSIRKQATEALTPVDLITQEAITPELVALLWQLYEHQGVVLFAGPTGAGKTTLLNAHMPFIRFDDRPIAIDEGAREVHLPHETGVALSTAGQENRGTRVSMAQLIEECNYLNPDVEVIGEINSPDSFQTFGEALTTGHGILGTTHAEDVETLINRVTDQGLAPYLLQEVDLVVFPRHIDGERYVSSAVEFVEQEQYETLAGSGGQLETDGETIYWNTVAERDRTGTTRFAYTHPRLGASKTAETPPEQIGDRLEDSAFDDEDWGVTPEQPNQDTPTCNMRVFHRIADRTDRPVQAVEAEYHRKLRYIRYLHREHITEFDALFEFLADLRTEEAATVERIARR